MELKHFQDEYVDRLVLAIRRKLKAFEDDPNLPLQHIVFKSPTGSGKTVMVAETLKRLSEKNTLDEHGLAFLWLAPMKLHAQSYKSLSNSLKDTSYSLINIDNGLRSGPLNENTILFSNWEKLTTTAGKDNSERDMKAGEWTNLATRQGETEKNLIDILRETRESGVKIVLIVDESHQAFYSEKSQKFVREVVQPSLVVEVSATPKFKSEQAEFIEVPYNEVVESGLIKQSIIVNNDLGKLAEKMKDKTTIGILLDLALRKQEELKNTYNKIGKKINPLILVQLPNDSSEIMSELDKTDKKLIEEILVSKGYTYDNKKLAIWLSSNEDKKNLNHIESLDNGVDVLIFKQAIALGWDCPRAQILVMLRDVKSESFKTQVLGRILRMPEAKKYEMDSLNTAYVYSDLKSIVIDKREEDFLPNLIKYKKSTIKEDLKDSNVVLPGSIYLSRIDYGDLRADFKPVLQGGFDDYFNLNSARSKEEKYNCFASELETNPEKLTQPIISDEIIEQIDDAIDREVVKTVEISADMTKVEALFNLLLRDFIKPFTGFARTRAIIYPALRDLFSSANIDEVTMKKIFVCSTKNQTILKKLFEKAIDNYGSIYQRAMKKRRDREGTEEDWTVPEEDVFSDNYEEADMRQNIYDHYFRKKGASENEIRFEKLLDASDSILWWHKNGEKMRQHFAVGYYEQMEDARTRRNSFYPDYIVRFKDGSIGIFETKSGADISPEYYSNSNNPRKANALQEWIHNHLDLGIWGGIINRSNSGELMIQGDAITHEMAIATLAGERIDLPDIDYDYSNWKTFTLSIDRTERLS